MSTLLLSTIGPATLPSTASQQKARSPSQQVLNAVLHANCLLSCTCIVKIVWHAECDFWNVSAGRNQQAGTSGSSRIPQTGYLLFDNAPNSQALLKKLREFNQTLAASTDTQAISLSQEQSTSALDHLVAR